MSILAFEECEAVTEIAGCTGDHASRSHVIDIASLQKSGQSMPVFYRIRLAKHQARSAVGCSASRSKGALCDVFGEGALETYHWP